MKTIIKREIKDQVETKLNTKKATIIYGARQVGKTTLVESIVGNDENVLWLTGDDPDVRSTFEDITSTALKYIIGDHHTVVIDEAQRIVNIGIKLKLITDQIPDVNLIVTGSSSFEFANKTKESLAGRKWEYQLFPLSFSELVRHNGLLEEKRLLEMRLIYGQYPDVITDNVNRKQILKELSDSYMYKDVLALEDIKKPDSLVKMLKALALQIGSQVSYSEIGQLCGLDYKTVEKYITLMEQAFIIFRLPAYNSNQRNELKKSRKIYFVDNGIRNVLINNFTNPEGRSDIGALWENYLVSERYKLINYRDPFITQWFWRSKTQQEVDFVEEKDGKLRAYEFKWNPAAKYREPASFKETYNVDAIDVIHRDNYDKFLLEL